MSEATDFGAFLRRAREGRGLSLGDIASVTRVPRVSLEAIESGDVATLPGDIFVRGFIRSYAKALGISETEPLALYERSIRDRSPPGAAPSSAYTAESSSLLPLATAFGDDDSMLPRRGLGLAVFVIVLLLIATITLSLLLRRPPQSGEGLSMEQPKQGPIAAADRGVVVGHPGSSSI